ncbi:MULTISPECIES: hypothetical protein [Gordonia]|uniref:hypothetical protein n=1 Tax=Gordonia TaxID=2053 RepID=UPI000467DCE8|nr:MULTISPECIES: hypothetical protein [Gordonia]KAF0970516.1 hypothetical protein BPODLACK_00785 [Gordonia sp. YY1]MCZ0913668.1 hypothetical protein [Gordonia amicalis]
MTTMIGINVHRPHRRAPRTIDVFGVEWPAHKAHAVLAGIATAVVALLILGSLQATAWVTAVAVLAVWWGERYLAGNAAVAPRSNPPGIS